VDVQAITVVNGVAHVGPGLENLRRLLAFVNRSSIPLWPRTTTDRPATVPPPLALPA
jgi:inosine-uridine nucleoside N-ribohydrolase